MRPLFEVKRFEFCCLLVHAALTTRFVKRRKTILITKQTLGHFLRIIHWRLLTLSVKHVVIIRILLVFIILVLSILVKIFFSIKMVI